jgi:hypothetical protein
LYLHVAENPIDPHHQKDVHHKVRRARRLGLNDGVMNVDTMVDVNDVDLRSIDVIECDVGGIEGRSYFRLLISSTRVKSTNYSPSGMVLLLKLCCYKQTRKRRNSNVRNTKLTLVRWFFRLPLADGFEMVVSDKLVVSDN